jgi:tetratricopeptide (TPR) repeat protein
MPNNTLLWIKPIGIVAILPLFQTIAVANNSTSISGVTGSITDLKHQYWQEDLLAQNTSQKAVNYFMTGAQKYGKQDYQGALADYNKAIQLDPNDPAPYLGRGNLKDLKIQDFRGGLADYSRVIQLDPNYALAYGVRGVLKHDRLNDRAGGIADLQQAAKLFQGQGDTKNYRMAIEQIKKWQQTGKNSDS